MVESSSSNFFDEAPSSQELRMATPTKKNKNTNKKQKKYKKMRKTFVEFAMSNTTVRWVLTMVHHGLAAKLQSVTIGSIILSWLHYRKSRRSW